MGDKEKIRAEVERLKDELIKAPNKSEIDMGRISAFEDILLYIDSLPEEPVNKNLEEEINRCAIVNYKDLAYHFANWQKENLWHDAQGDDLPEYEREVVVFTQNFPDDAGIMRVSIAHRPDPKGWDGKSLSTGKVEHFEPMTYDKGGWNMPNVMYWLDAPLPEGIE